MKKSIFQIITILSFAGAPLASGEEVIRGNSQVLLKGQIDSSAGYSKSIYEVKKMVVDGKTCVVSFISNSGTQGGTGTAIFCFTPESPSKSE